MNYVDQDVRRMLVVDHCMMGNCCPGLLPPHFPTTTRQQDIKTQMDADTKNCVSKSQSTSRDRVEDSETVEDVACDCEYRVFLFHNHGLKE